MKSAGNGRLPGKGVSLTPVFTTVNDREKYHDIRNKTKPQISVIITELLKDVERFGNVQEALVLERQWEKIKGTHVIVITYRLFNFFSCLFSIFLICSWHI